MTRRTPVAALIILAVVLIALEFGIQHTTWPLNGTLTAVAVATVAAGFFLISRMDRSAWALALLIGLAWAVVRTETWTESTRRSSGSQAGGVSGPPMEDGHEGHQH